jgi:hypothetical protein
MYSTLVRKIIRAVVIGTSLAVIPAVPFYIYTFDATPRQLAILIPLFIPALLSMLFADLFSRKTASVEFSRLRGTESFYPSCNSRFWSL